MARRLFREDAEMHRLDKLARLGSSTTIDYTKISKSTMLSLMSHVKLLNKHNIDFDNEGLKKNGIVMTPNEIYRSLDNMRNSKNKLLTSDYKRQILISIKRAYRTIYKNLDLKRYPHKAYTTPKAANTEHMSSIKVLIEQAAKYTKNVNSDGKILDLGLYDVCLAIMITCSSSLRIAEIMQLNMSILEDIRQGRQASIQSKATHMPRIVPLNNVLSKTIDRIIKQRPYVMKLLNDQNDSINMYVEEYKLHRIKDDYVIISSLSTLRKKLREFATVVGLNTVGFNDFRKFITTVLIDGGGHEVAKAMNNHSDIGTTIRHYSVHTPQASEDLYRAIHESVEQRRSDDRSIEKLLEEERKQPLNEYDDNDAESMSKNLIALSPPPSVQVTTKFSGI